MKKVLIGCGVVSLLVLVGGGIAAYYLVVKPAAQIAGSAIDGAREAVAKVGAAAQTIEAMRALEADVAAQGPYTAPADGALAQAQVERFLAVHQAVIDRLGPERARIAQAVEANPAQGDVAALAGSFAALAGLGDIGLAAKRAQVEALNAQGLSLAEYRWIRQAGIEALIAGGIELSAGASGARAAEMIRQAQQAAQQAAAAARAMGQVLPEGLTPPGDAAPGESEAAPGTEPVPPAGEGMALPALTPIQRANFDLVREHREAYAQSQLLALVGL
jgi:hypothetical protein